MKKLAEKYLETIIEMATIGTHKGYKITVHTEPLLQKSYHISWNNRENEIAVKYPEHTILEIKRLNKSKYKLKKGEKLPSYIQKVIDEFLLLKNSKNKKLRNDAALDFAWDILNEND